MKNGYEEWLPKAHTKQLQYILSVTRVQLIRKQQEVRDMENELRSRGAELPGIVEIQKEANSGPEKTDQGQE